MTENRDKLTDAEKYGSFVACRWCGGPAKRIAPPGAFHEYLCVSGWTYCIGKQGFCFPLPKPRPPENTYSQPEAKP